MNDRVTPAQFQKLIAEVERLQTQQQNELTTAQIREILQELNLDPALLPEALTQLKRREALVAQNRRRRWLVLGAIAAIGLFVGGFLLWHQHQYQALSRISAQTDQVTLQADDRPVRQIARPAPLAYQVTLQDVPVGQQLSLRCDWINPTGQVVHQNQYQTKPVTTAVWPTHCRYTVGADAMPGTWTVKMWQGDRVLSDASFEVN